MNLILNYEAAAVQYLVVASLVYHASLAPLTIWRELLNLEGSLTRSDVFGPIKLTETKNNSTQMSEFFSFSLNTPIYPSKSRIVRWISYQEASYIGTHTLFGPSTAKACDTFSSQSVLNPRVFESLSHKDILSRYIISSRSISKVSRRHSTYPKKTNNKLSNDHDVFHMAAMDHHHES